MLQLPNLFRRTTSKALDLPPVTPLWAYGVLVHNFDIFVRQMRKRHGDVFTCSTGLKRFTFVNGNAAADFFFGAPVEQLNFREGFRELFGPRYPAFPSDDEVAKPAPLREIFLPAFRDDYMRPVIGIIGEELGRVMSAWPKGKEPFDVDVFPTIHEVVMRAVTRFVAGPELGVDRFDEFRRWFSQIDLSVHSVNAFAPWGLMPHLTPLLYASHHAAMDKLEAMVGDVVRKRLRTGERGHDALQVLLDYYVSEPRADLDKIPRSILYGMFMAIQGDLLEFRIIAWTLLYLLNSKRHMDAVMAEIYEAIPDRAPASITLDTLRKLKRVQASMLESQRLKQKNFSVRLVKQDVRFQGYTIPRGDIMILPRVESLFDPATFPNPDEFDPDHIAPSNARRIVMQQCYGAGPHACPGQSLSFLLTAHIMTTWLLMFDLRVGRLSSEKAQDLGPPLSTKPLYLQFSRRDR